MGPSGTGKTTLLRLITGQVHAERGSVRVFGAEVSTMSNRELFALRRRMGMLFQNGALLTDLDVYETVAFPLREHRLARRAGAATGVDCTPWVCVALRGSCPPSFPAACPGAWRWRAPSSWIPRS